MSDIFSKIDTKRSSTFQVRAELGAMSVGSAPSGYATHGYANTTFQVVSLRDKIGERRFVPKGHDLSEILSSCIGFVPKGHDLSEILSSCIGFVPKGHDLSEILSSCIGFVPKGRDPEGRISITVGSIPERCATYGSSAKRNAPERCYYNTTPSSTFQVRAELGAMSVGSAPSGYATHGYANTTFQVVSLRDKIGERRRSHLRDRSLITDKIEARRRSHLRDRSLITDKIEVRRRSHLRDRSLITDKIEARRRSHLRDVSLITDENGEHRGNTRHTSFVQTPPDHVDTAGTEAKK